MAISALVKPRLVVEEAALIDEPASLRLVGLAPGERATIAARAADAAGRVFASHSTFEADEAGEVDVARLAPIAGGYTGVDPFGIWWSMTSSSDDRFVPGLAPVTARLEAILDGRVARTATVQRLTMAQSVRRYRVSDGVVVGALFVPEGHPAPPVVVLGGSGGGLQWSAVVAALLASRGFTVLAVAYFGAPGRPPRLIDVPLEDVGAALRWVLGRPEVAGERVTLVGRSRGAELALEVAARYPEVRGVVGFSASAVRWGGFDPASSSPRAAWLWRGRELPYLLPDQAAVQQAWEDSPVRLGHAFARALEDAAAAERARIHVEEIAGPILLISGGEDQMWPSGDLSRIAARSRQAVRSGAADAHLLYGAAGHAVGQPAGLPLHDVTSRHPLDGITYLLGGTTAGNAASGRAAWPRILEFIGAAAGSGGV